VVIKMKMNRIALGIAALTVMVLLVSTASACTLPGLSPGYWKHNVKVYCGGPGHYSGDPHETDDSMESYELWIRNNIAGQGSFTLEWANERFQDNAYKSMWLTIANWFNAAADRFPYSD
jgi:hypothetical protein